MRNDNDRNTTFLKLIWNSFEPRDELCV